MQLSLNVIEHSRNMHPFLFQNKVLGQIANILFFSLSAKNKAANEYKKPRMKPNTHNPSAT